MCLCRGDWIVVWVVAGIISLIIIINITYLTQTIIPQTPRNLDRKVFDNTGETSQFQREKSVILVSSLEKEI